jgi:hypothetical protein
MKTKEDILRKVYGLGKDDPVDWDNFWLLALNAFKAMDIYKRIIHQYDSNLIELSEGDRLDVYWYDEEFDKSDLIAIDAVIEYDVENAQYIIRKDTIIIPFAEYHNGNYTIYKKGSVYD